MYTLAATLQAALESGNYAPYFNAKIIDAANGTTLFEASTPPSGGGAVTDYKLNRLSLTITLQSSTFIDINYFLVRLQFSRGVTIGGQQYTLDTSDYFITDAFWDGNFQTFTCNLFPQTYYTADGALTYQEVIEAFCTYFGKTAIFLDDTADWLAYQFLPDGHILTLNNAQRFFTLLRQKHFIFATDNGDNEILFYAAWQNVADPQYDIDAYGFDVNYHHQHRRQYLWRDENGTVHRTETSFKLIQQLGSANYVLSFADLGSGIVLAGTAGNLSTDGEIYRSTDYGLTWELVLSETISFQVFALLNLGSGIVLAGDYGAGAGGRGGRIYRSTNYGATWTVTYTLPSTLYGFLCLVNLDNGIVLAGTKNGRIYRSTDYGLDFSTYTQLTETWIWTFADLGGGVVLAGVEANANIYRSTDYGQTWVLVQQLGTETKVLSLIYLGNGIVLAGTAGGGKVFRSTDSGLTWSLIGQLDAELSVFHFDTFGYGFIIAETFDNAKLFQSTDAGLTWTLITNLGTETDIRAAIALTNGTFIAGTGPNGQIWRSENADAFLNSVHNLGFMPSTATEPTKYSQARAPVFAPFLVNLKYQSSDHITVNLLPTDATYKLLCADVTEELDLKQSRLPWRMTITDTQWLTNTEGGALPSTIERVAAYTPLVTSDFNGLLDETINNLQTLANAVDDLFEAFPGDGTQYLGGDGLFHPLPTTVSMFLSSTNSDIGGYETLSHTRPTGAETSASASISAADTVIEEFIHTAGEFDFISAQELHCHIHLAKTAGVKDATAYVKAYHRTSGGTETLLATSEVTGNLTGSNTPYDFDLAIADTEFAATDRFLIKVFASPNGSGTTPTVTLYFEGDTDSRVELGIFLTPTETRKSIQLSFTHGANAGVPASSTRFLGFEDVVSGLQTAAYNITIPVACTIKNLYINTNSAQPASGSLVFTIMKNTSTATAITITVPAGAAAAQFSDLVNSAALAAGDAITMRIVNNATGTSATIIRCVLELDIPLTQ
jgi:photosystem II stability/assembly factor-like uncharacterized protein